MREGSRMYLESGLGLNLDDPINPEPVVRGIDARWLHVEARECGTDLASMVGAVVQRLGQPDSHGGVPLVSIVLADLFHDGVRIRVCARKLDHAVPSASMAARSWRRSI